MSFSNDINEWTKTVVTESNDVKIIATLELFKRIVASTPVDTGRLRGNWQVSVEQPITSQIEALDAAKNGGGAATVTRNQPVIFGSDLKQTIYITNNMEYALKIEYQHGVKYSKKAPNGMVRIHLTEWPEIVESAKAQDLINRGLL